MIVAAVLIHTRVAGLEALAQTGESDSCCGAGPLVPGLVADSTTAAGARGAA